MVVYKTVDLFSQKTGEKIGTQKIFDFRICDFTGEKIDQYENPNTYGVNYQDNDPCFGDGDGERWLYPWNHEDDEEEKEDLTSYADPYNLFNQSEYIFKTFSPGYEVFDELLKTAKKNKMKIISLDHLLRWSRGKMLEKVITEGTYKIDQFDGRD